MRLVSPLESFAELDHPGNALRERRIELGWSQAELSSRTGIPQADISRIENSHLDARWSTIHRLSTALAATEKPKRSLANGNRRTAPVAGKRPKLWAPSGSTLEIT
jgi:predicted transcriptional regulator